MLKKRSHSGTGATCRLNQECSLRVEVSSVGKEAECIRGVRERRGDRSLVRGTLVYASGLHCKGAAGRKPCLFDGTAAWELFFL